MLSDGNTFQPIGPLDTNGLQSSVCPPPYPGSWEGKVCTLIFFKGNLKVSIIYV